jgi:hypothetical protein
VKRKSPLVKGDFCSRSQAPAWERTFGLKLSLGNLRLLKDIAPTEITKQELCIKWIPKLELGNQKEKPD